MLYEIETCSNVLPAFCYLQYEFLLTYEEESQVTRIFNPWVTAGLHFELGNNNNKR